MAAPTFEWDPHKAAANLKRHGVSLDEAATVFQDPLAKIHADPDHSFVERRERFSSAIRWPADFW